MKVYNEAGKCANADKEQIPIMLEAGWSLKKPEAKPEAKPVVPDKAKDEFVVDGIKAEEPKVEKTPGKDPSVEKRKVKKVRKIPKK